MTELVIDAFAGPGGWDEAALDLGFRPVGIEHDLVACQTRAHAGHRTIHADVAELALDHLAGQVDGLIASPPCQAYSAAGKRDGQLDVPRIIEHAHACTAGWVDYGRDGWTDNRAPLVLEVLRYALTLRPGWIACEQVPEVLPLWEVFAHVLEQHGWHTWTGILNAADYGVPQTRRRAFLLAARTPIIPPAPTHDRDPMPSLFGTDLLPWVSMGAALGWTAPATTFGDMDGNFRFRVGFPRLDDLGTSPDGYRERDWRADDEPAFTLTEKARSWVVQTGNNSHVTSRTGSKAGDGGVELYERPITEPAPTLDAKVGGAWRVVGVNTGRDWKKGGTRDDAQIVPPDELDGKGRWHAILEQPATTVAGDPRISARCHHDEGSQGKNPKTVDQVRAGDYDGTEPIRLGITDALVLQSFRADYPVQGNKTKQFEQVGNAIPVLLARHALNAVRRTVRP